MCIPRQLEKKGLGIYGKDGLDEAVGLLEPERVVQTRPGIDDLQQLSILRMDWESWEMFNHGIFQNSWKPLAMN